MAEYSRTLCQFYNVVKTKRFEMSLSSHAQHKNMHSYRNAIAYRCLNADNCLFSEEQVIVIKRATKIDADMTARARD